MDFYGAEAIARSKIFAKIIDNIISCKCHRCIICWRLIDVTYIARHFYAFFVGSLSFLDQVRLQSVCFLLSTKVGFGMSNLQASLRRTSSCPFRDCCSRWARDPNRRTQFDLIQVQKDNAKTMTWRRMSHVCHVWCLPSRMTWAMLSAFVSPSVSGVFEIRHLQISGYKADMVRSMQWRISDSFDVVCSKFSLSILILFDDFKGCWSCAAQSWRGVSRWKDELSEDISENHLHQTWTGNYWN